MQLSVYSHRINEFSEYQQAGLRSFFDLVPTHLSTQPVFPVPDCLTYKHAVPLRSVLSQIDPTTAVIDDSGSPLPARIRGPLRNSAVDIARVPDTVPPAVARYFPAAIVVLIGKRSEALRFFRARSLLLRRDKAQPQASHILLDLAVGFLSHLPSFFGSLVLDFHPAFAGEPLSGLKGVLL